MRCFTDRQEISFETVREYGEFIRRFHWDWWCTLTFSRAPSIDRAISAYKCWIHWINRRTFGNNYFKHDRGVRWVRGTERQSAGGIHFHALVAGCDALPIPLALRRWKRLAGDAKIVPYTPQLGASHYVSKTYVTHGDLDIGGCWPADVHPSQLRDFGAL